MRISVLKTPNLERYVLPALKHNAGAKYYTVEDYFRVLLHKAHNYRPALQTRLKYGAARRWRVQSQNS